MPSTGQTFDELTSYISNETMLPTSNAWNSPASYSNGHASYATTAPTSQPYYRPAINTSRGHQNLPSLTEMNLSNNAPTFSSRPTSMPRQHASNGYYAGSTTDPLEISYNKPGQSGYGSSFGVVNNSRSQYINSYNDWSPISETYCYPNGHSWPPTMQCSSYVNSDTASLHSGRRRRGNLPKQVTDILRSWFHEHLDHPYPTDEDKQMLIMKTGLTISQISNWFINARRRHWPQLKQQRDQQMHKLPPRLPGNGGPH